MKKYAIVFIYNCMFILILCSCNSKKGYDKLLGCFKKENITVPYDKMQKNSCSLFQECNIDSSIILVNYFQEVRCAECLVSQISFLDKERRRNEMKSVKTIYIVKSKIEQNKELYKGLCGERVSGDVFFDNTNAFLSANPHIPDNELFHTFVINSEGNVLMVGNPFQNEKMEVLFKKVVANERRKQKAKKAA